MFLLKQSVLRTLVPKRTALFSKRTAYNLVLVLMVLKRPPCQSMEYTIWLKSRLIIYGMGGGGGGGGVRGGGGGGEGGSVLGKSTVFTSKVICKIV